MARRSLPEVAGEFAAGRATPQVLHDAFLTATVFCEAGERPGFAAVGSPGDGFIPVFSSEVSLARARGAVKWFSTTGEDLFGLVPNGYDLILDIAGPVPLRLNPAEVQGTAAAEAAWQLEASFAFDPPPPVTPGALIARLTGDRYDAYIDQPIPSDTDDDVRALLDAYMSTDPEGRAYILEHLTIRPAETIGCYADRLAVLAVRTEATEPLRLGLVCVGMVVGRVDYPGFLTPMSKLDYSAHLLGVDLTGFVEGIAQFLPEQAQTFLDRWLAKEARGDAALKEMGHTAQGSGPDFNYVRSQGQ